MTMRAALYARYSTDMQSEASVEDQLRVCERLAEQNGMTVVAKFFDRGISGGTTSRPGYQQMLDAARRHQFDAVIAEDSSRLWRELSEQWRALKELKDLRIDVIGNGLDTRREESKILLSVSGAMAEAYRDEIARRTRRGLEGLALKGRPSGGRAYGYVSAKESGTGNIEIQSEHAATVRQIFEWFAAGKSPRWIAAELNRQGVLSPGASWNRQTGGKRQDGKWMASAIHGEPIRGTGILNNTKYIGQWTWGREKWVRGAADSHKRTRQRPDLPAITTTDERLRIVPQDLWQRVKARQAHFSKLGESIRTTLKSRGGRRNEHLLSGEIRCPECKANFVIVDARHYGCSTHKNGGPAACGFDVLVRRDAAETAVHKLLREELLGEEAVAEFKNAYSAEIARLRKAGKKSTAVPAAAVQAKLARYDAAIASLRDQVRAGTLPDDVAGPAIAAADASRRAVLDQAEAKDTRRMAEVVQLLPSTADMLSESIRMAIAGREFLEPMELAQSKRNLREMLGNQPITVEEGQNRRPALRVRLESGALIRLAAGVVCFRAHRLQTIPST